MPLCRLAKTGVMRSENVLLLHQLHQLLLHQLHQRLGLRRILLPVLRQNPAPTHRQVLRAARRRRRLVRAALFRLQVCHRQVLRAARRRRRLVRAALFRLQNCRRAIRAVPLVARSLRRYLLRPIRVVFQEVFLQAAVCRLFHFRELSLSPSLHRKR